MVNLKTQVSLFIALYLPIVGRIILAIFGSYILAVGIDLVFLALPIDRLSAIYWGQIFSIIACAATIILVFSTRTALAAWSYVSVISSLLFGIWYLFG